MMDALPSSTGGVNVIVAWPFPAVTVPIVGASETVAGVMVLEALDALLVPRAFVAVTVKVYACTVGESGNNYGRRSAVCS